MQVACRSHFMNLKCLMLCIPGGERRSDNKQAPCCQDHLFGTCLLCGPLHGRRDRLDHFSLESKSPRQARPKPLDLLSEGGLRE